MSIKVAVIEDHKAFRESIVYLLKNSKGFLHNGDFERVEESFEMNQEPNVILLDIELPGISGIKGIPQLKEKYPEASIIILTVFEDNKNVFEAILNGADGYLLKKSSPDLILKAITEVTEGGAPMTPTIAKQALGLFKSHLPAKNENNTLSERESEVLNLIVQGFGNDEVAKKLFISPLTVKNHIRHIYEKLHVHSRAQVVSKAIKEGLAE
ncbi:MAG: response regulator transcription factor [Ignavibacteriaceae bacterium]